MVVNPQNQTLTLNIYRLIINLRPDAKLEAKPTLIVGFLCVDNSNIPNVSVFWIEHNNKQSTILNLK